MSQRIEDNMHLVDYVLNRFYNGGIQLAKFHSMEVDDLRQIGSIGLIKADRDYLYSKNASFFTYAVHKIRGEIRRFMRDNNHSVRFPRSIKEVARQLQDAETMSVEQIMENTGVTRLDALGVIHYVNRKPISMSYMINQDSESFTLDDVIPAKENTADEALRKVELQERLNLLSPKTKQVCHLVLHGHDQMSAAKHAGISQSRASRHLSNAVKLIEKQYSTY